MCSTWADRHRAWLAVAGCYVTARLLLVATLDPTQVPDTGGYYEIDLLGRATRPWLMPVVFAATTDRILVFVHAIVSALAFLTLAAAVGSEIRSHRIRAVVMAAILLLGVTPRVTSWDAAMMTESLALSLTCLLIAVTIGFDQLPSWVIVATFVGWVFIRDAHIYLGVAVAAGLGIYSLVRRRRTLAVLLAIVAAWGAATTRGDDTIEAYNVTSSVTFRISRDGEYLQWFFDEGMPVGQGFLVMEPFGRLEALLADEAFQEWAGGDGVTAYTKFVATHPRFALRAVHTIFADDDLNAESMVDETFYPITFPPSGPLRWIWPAEGTVWTMTLVGAALALMLLVVRAQRLDRRFVAPSILLLSTVPHAFLVFHGAPISLARHALIVAFVLVVSSIWLIALSVDSLTRPRADDAESLATTT